MALHHSKGNEKLLEIITYLSNNKHFNPNLGGGRGGKQNIFDSFYEWLLHAMWKGSKKLERWVESEYTLHHWPRSSENEQYSRLLQ